MDGAAQVVAEGVGGVVEVVLVEARVGDEPLAAGDGGGEHRVDGLPVLESEPHPLDHRLEGAVAPEDRMAPAGRGRVPEADAAVHLRGPRALSEAPACGEVVGVAADVGVVGGRVVEADAAVVLVVRIPPERVDVGQEVAAGAHADADAAVGYTHVRERVVVRLDPDAQGVVGTVADDVSVFKGHFSASTGFEIRLLTYIVYRAPLMWTFGTGYGFTDGHDISFYFNLGM